MLSHADTHLKAQTHTAGGWFIKLLLLILNNPETFTPHLPCCCFWLIHGLHVCRIRHTHTRSPPHAHMCFLLFQTATHTSAFAHILSHFSWRNKGVLGPLSLLPKLRIERKREGKRAEDTQDDSRRVCVCVPVGHYKSHLLVKGTIHHSLLGSGCGWRLFYTSSRWMMRCFTVIVIESFEISGKIHAS